MNRASQRFNYIWQRYSVEDSRARVIYVAQRQSTCNCSSNTLLRQPKPRISEHLESSTLTGFETGFFIQIQGAILIQQFWFGCSAIRANDIASVTA